MGNWKNFVKNFCSKESNVEVLRTEAEKDSQTTECILVQSTRLEKLL